MLLQWLGTLASRIAMPSHSVVGQSVGRADTTPADGSHLTKKKLKWAEDITDSLLDMARVNWYDFANDPALCEAYARNLKSGRHKYVADKLTCGHDDCWSTYKSLRRRYQKDDPKGTILLDCEDAACAHAGWLAAQCFGDSIYVGLIPGRRVSHAIAGVMPASAGALAGEDKIRIVDPARWFGMGETSYANPVWRKVAW